MDNTELFYALLLATGTFIFVGILLFTLKSKTKSQPQLQSQPQQPQAPEDLAPEQKPQIPAWRERLKSGLKRSSEEIWGKIEKIITLSGNKMTQEEIDQIEALLYAADLGPRLVSELMEALEKEKKNQSENFDLVAMKKFFYHFLSERMAPVQAKVQASPLYQFDPAARSQAKGPQVILVVGVNGAGKTTTIGKLARRFADQGAKVIVGAGDTFRAAAVDQLQTWCERAGVEMIRGKEGADPSGVAYEALQMAITQEADYCILDTAGRLHTKVNLMEELKKNKRVLSKLNPLAPHHTFLVLDAITGQNALKQAREFHEALTLSELVFTKCDGSSKAGSAVAIVQELQVPIAFIGVGESVEDLGPFLLEDYLKGLLNLE